MSGVLEMATAILSLSPSLKAVSVVCNTGAVASRYKGDAESGADLTPSAASRNASRPRVSIAHCRASYAEIVTVGVTQRRSPKREKGGQAKSLIGPFASDYKSLADATDTVAAPIACEARLSAMRRTAATLASLRLGQEDARAGLLRGR